MSLDITLRGVLHWDDLSEGQQREVAGISDKRIWTEFRAGSDVAFEVIYRRNEEHLFYYGMKIVRDEQLVWDSIQDLFVELWDAKSRLGKVKCIKPYLFKALRNKLIRSATKQKNILRIVDDNDPAVNLKNQSSEENRFEEEEHRTDVERKLKKALSTLSRKQQEIIYLRFYDGLSTKEITTITGIKKRTVNHNLNQALKLLNEMGEDLFLFLLLTPVYHYTYGYK